MNQKGFVPIIFILGIIIASGLIIGGAFYMMNNQSKLPQWINQARDKQPIYKGI